MSSLHPELKAIGLIVAAAAMGAITVMVSSAGSRNASTGPPTAAVTPSRTPTRLPPVVAGPLDGLPTARRLALRRPLAVVIDNFFPDARPQPGIARASVVFDTVTEGGITRLMALFAEHDAPKVGPIRSARPYFVQWAAGFRAILVHGGGAPAALELLGRTPEVGNVEALLPERQFFRARDRLAPHNLFASTGGIRDVARKRGWDEPGSYHWLSHEPRVRYRSRGPDATIRISFSTPAIASPPAYSVAYRYVRRRDVYLRFLGDQPYTDGSTHAQVAASNVAVLTTSIRPVPGDAAGRVAIRVLGRGQATLFRDGRTLRGTWSKASAAAPLLLFDRDGQEMTLVPGQTWIEVAAPGSIQPETP